MAAPKNYTVGEMCKGKEAEISEALRKNPHWTIRDARENVARKEFHRRIKEAGRKTEAVPVDVMDGIRKFMQNCIEPVGGGVAWGMVASRIGVAETDRILKLIEPYIKRKS